MKPFRTPARIFTDQKRARPFAESCVQLDITRIARLGLDNGVEFRAESSDHEIMGEGSVEALDEKIILAFTDNHDVHIRKTLSFERHQSGMAPPRLWFVCEECRKRCGIIYLYGKHWACRVCHDLVYASQYTTQYDKILAEYLKLEEIGPERQRYERLAAYEHRLQRQENLGQRLKEMPRMRTHADARCSRVTMRYWRFGHPMPEGDD